MVLLIVIAECFDNSWEAKSEFLAFERQVTKSGRDARAPGVMDHWDSALCYRRSQTLNTFDLFPGKFDSVKEDRRRALNSQ